MGAGSWYSLLPSVKSGKYRETEGIKDYYDVSGGGDSVFERFYDWSQRGNYDNAVVVSDLTVKENFPLNPTKAVVPSGYRLQRYDGNIDSWVTMTYMPFEWYDCTTKGTLYALNGQAYYGYKAGGGGSAKSRTITALVKKEG